MARRKDHTPEQLKHLILQSAEKIIHSKGLENLTARALARAIGYTPGTIYNFYRNMESLVSDINYETLGRLQNFCQSRIEGKPATMAKILALAYAYVDFAESNRRSWETIFLNQRKNPAAVRLPKHYQERLLETFQLIENVLEECLIISHQEARSTARLLWACLHGITVLALDGRLSLIGASRPHRLIDDLIEKYLSNYKTV